MRKRLLVLLIALIATIAVTHAQKRTTRSKTPARKTTVVKSKSPAKAVDLGLPSGTLWASCNVGATKPEGFGSYFAWGDSKTSVEYTFDKSPDAILPYILDARIQEYLFSGYRLETEDNYSLLMYIKSDERYMAYYPSHEMRKYVKNENLISGFCDDKTELDLEDDAAYVNWGSNWRMPSLNQIKELKEKCTWTWTQLNGVNGYRVTSKKNGNSIFLPAAGWRRDATLDFAGSDGGYWSRSLYTSYPSNAYYLYFRSGDVGWSFNSRYHGRSVRPVRR